MNKKKYALFQMLFASIDTDFIAKKSVKFLKHLSKNPLTGEGFDLPSCFKVKGVGFILKNTGSEYSDDYREKVNLMLLEHGATDEIVDMVRSAQSQGVNLILFEKDGQFPEPREVSKTNWKKLPKRISDRQWRELKSSLMHVEDLWPLEILANVMNGLAERSQKRTARKRK